MLDDTSSYGLPPLSTFPFPLFLGLLFALESWSQGLLRDPKLRHWTIVKIKLIKLLCLINSLLSEWVEASPEARQTLERVKGEWRDLGVLEREG